MTAGGVNFKYTSKLFNANDWIRTVFPSLAIYGTVSCSSAAIFAVLFKSCDS